MKRLILISMMLGLTLAMFADQATRQLQGEVRDETGEELTGVTVKVDGTNIAAATDIDGKFQLNVPAGRELHLTVSYVGYATQSVKVSPDRNDIKITMEVNASDMNEVVVIGYGTSQEIFAHVFCRSLESLRPPEDSIDEYRPESGRPGVRSWRDDHQCRPLQCSGIAHQRSRKFRQSSARHRRSATSRYEHQ